MHRATSLINRARNMNKLHKVFSATSIVLGIFGSASLATAQSKPICFMTDNAGKVTDLSDICNVRSNQNQTNEPITRLNNLLDTADNTNNEEVQVENIYFVGDGDIPFSLGTASSTYYAGDEPVYVRRYRTAVTENRDAVRRDLLETGANGNNSIVTVNGTSFVPGQTPFIIYRYQK
jgi:hypothetical protein